MPPPRRRPPSARRPAVCLRGDQDGGVGGGVARAATTARPVSAGTGPTRGGGQRQARPLGCFLGRGAARRGAPPSEAEVFPSEPGRPTLPLSPCRLPAAGPAEAMEDEERRKKLEAGKAKVSRARRGEARRGRVGPAWGRGGAARFANPPTSASMENAPFALAVGRLHACTELQQERGLNLAFFSFSLNSC